MYRYILSDGKEKVTLEEELTYVKNYPDTGISFSAVYSGAL